MGKKDGMRGGALRSGDDVGEEVGEEVGKVSCNIYKQRRAYLGNIALSFFCPLLLRFHVLANRMHEVMRNYNFLHEYRHSMPQLCLYF
jgi:hypothetical protein